MANTPRLAPILLCVIWASSALPCKLGKRPIWTKDPRSTSALFRVVIGGKAGYVDRNGRVVIAPAFDPFYVEPGDGDFIEGRALVLVSDGLKFRSVFIDETGKELAVSFTYRFSEGLAAFEKSTREQKFDPHRPFGHAEPRGYMDRLGTVVIAPQFAYAGPFSEGLAAVALDGFCWVAGWRGSRFPAPSAPMEMTDCGFFAADWVTKPCRHGYIDKTGRFVIPARYQLAQEFSEGRAAVRNGGKWGFIDGAGNEITNCDFDEVRPFSAGKAAVRVRDRWGYIDRLGSIVIQPKYADALPFSAGAAAVKTGDRYHYIDEYGAEAIPGPFLQATRFVQGLAHVQFEETSWAWIDPRGKVVFRYDWKQEF